MQTAISSHPRDAFMRQLDFVLSRWTESISKAWLQNMSQSWSRQTAPCGNTRRFWPMAPCCRSLDAVIAMASFFSGYSPSVTLACIRGRMLGCVLNCSLHSQRQTQANPKIQTKTDAADSRESPPHAHTARWLLAFLLQLACSPKTHLLASH